MKVTIIIEAQHIPEALNVRKPTGTKTYTMRRDGIKVYAEGAGGGNKPMPVYGAGNLHIQSEAHIQVVGAGTLLALDFSCVSDAESFLEDLPHE